MPIALYSPNVTLLTTKGKAVPVTAWSTSQQPIALQWASTAQERDRVQTLATPLDCPVDSLRGLRRYALAFTADPADRLPVLAQPVVFTSSEGLETHVLPGVPVHEIDDTWRFGDRQSSGLEQQILQAGGHSGALTVPDDRVAAFFIPMQLSDYSG